MCLVYHFMFLLLDAALGDRFYFSRDIKDKIPWWGNKSLSYLNQLFSIILCATMTCCYGGIKHLPGIELKRWRFILIK